MLRVGLTGGIGTGKSHVAARLAGAGVPVIDADVVAREVVAPGTAGLARVVERFGPEVIGADGTLRRAELGAIVFADQDARHALEAIVHPAVQRAIDQWFDGLPEPTPIAVADIPLLFETGRDRDFDVVIVAWCPPALQVKRVMARDGVSEAAVRQRMAAQWPIADKVARAGYAIDTSGSFEDTNAAVDEVLNALRARTPRS